MKNLTSRLGAITIDVNDMPLAVAFWRVALNATVDESVDFDSATFLAMKLPDQEIKIFLQLVPEKKTAKTRMHLDIEAKDTTKEVARLVKLGAKVIRPLPDKGFAFAVMQDPFGNEFCVLPS